MRLGTPPDPASLDPIEREIARYRRYERVFHPLRFLHTLPLSHVFGQFMGLWLPAVLSAEVHFSDLPEASRLISANPARSIGLEDRGVIAPEAVADLTVWAADPVEAEVDELPGIPILLTVVDGRVVHEFPG